MNAVARAQLAFQMLTLLQKYHLVMSRKVWVNIKSGNGLNIAWWHQAITRTNVDWSSIGLCGIHMKHSKHKPVKCV